jgi:O-antigen/teichoic acid export membrane protein
MNLRFLVAHNFLMQLLGKFITAGTTFLITILLARSYKASGYGDFTTMMTYVSVFYLLVDFGLNAAFLKKSHGEETTHSLFASLLTLRGIISLVLMFVALSILVFIQTPGFSPAVRVGIIVLLPTILTQGLVTTFNALFQKELQYDKAALSVLGGSIVTLVIVYMLGFLGAPLIVTVSAFVIGGIVMGMTSYVLSRAFIPQLSMRGVSRPMLSSLFVTALPLGISLLFNTIHFRADIFIMAITRSSSDVGIYGLATKFFEFPLTIPTFFMNAVYPIMLSVHSAGNQKKWVRIIRESIIFLSLSSIVIAGVSFAAAPLLSFVQEDFMSSIVPFRILASTLPLFFLSSLLSWIMIARGKTWNLVLIYGAAMLLNIVLNKIFIPQFGPIAAAAVTGVSEGFVLILLAIFVVKYRFIKTV